MADRSRYTTTLSFIDFLFNLVIALTALFLLSILLINPPKQETTQKREAEYFIVIKWQDNNNNDIDLWVTDGDSTVNFITRQQATMSLDRDDVGPDDPVTHTHFLPQNEEIVTIRSKNSAVYTANIHVYNMRDRNNLPVVAWALINARSNKVEATGAKTLQHSGQEVTLFRVYINNSGEVQSIDKEIEYYFINGTK
jgi:hypothetical protein